MPITRRRLIAASGGTVAAGGAVAVLSACGSSREEPSDSRDVELLQPALDAETKVANLYRIAARQPLEPRALDAVESFGKRANEQVGLLEDAITGAGGSPAPPSGGNPAAENVLEALTLGLNDAIAAYNASVGGLSTPELRHTVFELMSTDAAQLAAIDGLLGSEQAPEPFVTGGKEPPLTAVSAADAAKDGS
jgi:hypothetical protein